MTVADDERAMARDRAGEAMRADTGSEPPVETRTTSASDAWPPGGIDPADHRPVAMLKLPCDGWPDMGVRPACCVMSTSTGSDADWPSLVSTT
jgi:hypothetical protein